MIGRIVESGDLDVLDPLPADAADADGRVRARSGHLSFQRPVSFFVQEAYQRVERCPPRPGAIPSGG
ncbi:MAG: hypothetical protein MZW92_15040 [Comamonadaceae bacterium]|nr:hypothetical protein [Comamonadaceae bacterium]